MVMVVRAVGKVAATLVVDLVVVREVEAAVGMETVAEVRAGAVNMAGFAEVAEMPPSMAEMANLDTAIALAMETEGVVSAQGAMDKATVEVVKTATVARVSDGPRGMAPRREAGWQTQSLRRGSCARSCSTA